MAHASLGNRGDRRAALPWLAGCTGQLDGGFRDIAVVGAGGAVASGGNQGSGGATGSGARSRRP
ncbi:MAG TPA: hypothetical protein VGP07_07020 [Polyangia bacterium]